ncbi:MAG: ABC transporter permease [Planctomyces sp.]|jgi:lipopolysaccharide transport system permease protein
MSAMKSADDLPVRVITPHDGRDAFLHAVTSLVRDWSFTTNLAWRMFRRDTVAQFRGSFLGWFWIIIPTLANSAVWIFLGSSVISIDSGSVAYPLYVFVGNLLWTGFSGCLLGGLGVLGEAQGALSKVNFPHEALVLVVFGKSILNVAVTLLALPLFMIIYPVTWHPEILLFPIGLLMTMICGLSLGLVLVPVTALFSDLSRAIQLGMRFAFFLTPVVLPLPPSGFARTLMLWNPATSLIVASRAWLLGGEHADLLAVSCISIVSILVLLVSVLAIKIAIPHIIERTAGG